MLGSLLYTLLLLLTLVSCSKHLVDIKVAPSCVHEIVYAGNNGIYQYFKRILVESKEESDALSELAKIDCGSKENIFAIRRSYRNENADDTKSLSQNSSNIRIIQLEVWCKSHKKIVCHST